MKQRSFLKEVSTYFLTHAYAYMLQNMWNTISKVCCGHFGVFFHCSDAEP